MTRSHSKKVILLAPEVFPSQLVNGYANVRHVSAINHLFPAIFELNPDLLIIDHDFIGQKDAEKILRRISSNKFYNHIRVQCFMARRNTKTEDLLKVLGVDHFVFREELLKDQKAHGVLNTVNAIIDNSMAKLATSVSN